MTQALAA